MGGRLVPLSWNALVQRLRSLGFEGPYRGGKHYFMVKGTLKLTVPNSHSSDISVPLLKEILNRANISREEWLK